MTANEEILLVKAAAGGDEAAFEELVKAHQGHVYKLAMKLTGSHEEALDVSQEVFLKAYRSLGSFRGESRFSVWLYRLTCNASMDIIKRSRRSALVPMPTDGDGAELDIPDLSPTPEEQVERRETLRAVREAIGELDGEKRRILLMREYGGMTYSQIADLLGIEEGTVKSRLARARAALAEILRKRGTFSGDEPSKERKNDKGR